MQQLQNWFFHVSSSSWILNIMMEKNIAPNQLIYKIWFWPNLTVSVWLSLIFTGQIIFKLPFSTNFFKHLFLLE